VAQKAGTGKELTYARQHPRSVEQTICDGLVDVFLFPM
jgi:hypothetical protein